ncbi:MAG: TetR family transcriptional regulator [Acidimicrobiales bacterium]
MVSTRRRAGRKSRRDEVLAAALSLFRAEGVMSVSPTDVGRAVDMTATAIRYHFPTTDDLLLALTDDLFDDLEAAMATYPDDPDWPDGVIPMVTDFVNVVLEHRDAALLIRQDGYLLSRPEFGGRLQEILGKIRRAITGPDPDMAATVAAVTAVGGIWRPIEVLEPEHVADHIDQIVSVILSGHPRRN